MSRSSRRIRLAVVARAGGCCEYCRLHSMGQVFCHYPEMQVRRIFFRDLLNGARSRKNNLATSHHFPTIVELVMIRTYAMALAGLALAGWALSARAQDSDVRDLVLKAQKAHGGRALLAKYRGAQAKYKGDVDANGMQAKVEGEVLYNYPDRMKNVIEVEVNNMKIQVQQGYDGKVLWISVLGMKQEFKDQDKIAEMKAGLYADRVATLADIEDKEYQLTSLGEVKIKDADAVGVRVSKKDKRDVNLWFDKKSHLLLKSEFRGTDPFGQGGEVNQEKYFLGYKAVMDVQSPTRMVVHHDGKKIVELEMSDMRYHEALDDTHFQQP